MECARQLRGKVKRHFTLASAFVTFPSVISCPNGRTLIYPRSLKVNKCYKTLGTALKIIKK